jgi:hypothetical protein
MKRTYLAIAVSAFAVLFGGLTLWSGGAVLFVDGAARADAGAYIPFVLWFNFLTGFALIVTGAGIYLGWNRVRSFAPLVALVSVLVFITLGIAIMTGVDYEARTVVAMILRCAIWLGLTVYTRRYLARV